jgi:hypothetical protein
LAAVALNGTIDHRFVQADLTLSFFSPSGRTIGLNSLPDEWVSARCRIDSRSAFLALSFFAIVL